MTIILDTAKPNILFFLIFIIFSAAQAQEKIAPPKPFVSRIEASAGINYSNPSNGTFPSYLVIPKLGYLVSVDVSHDFSRIISLDLSVLYERKNSKTSDDVLDQSLSPPLNLNTINEIGLNYLTIGTITNFRLGKSSRFFIGIGGY